MTSQDTKETDQAAGLNASVLYERGMDYFQQGDFLAARNDFKKVLESNPSTELEQKSKAMLKKLGVDPVEIGVGVLVFLLLLFLFVYFGLA